MQAHVPGMKKALTEQSDSVGLATGDSSFPERPAAGLESTDSSQTLNDQQVIQEVEAEEAADEFDYLAYAQDRALFFWSDLLALGFIKEEELPTDMIPHIKKRMIGF